MTTYDKNKSYRKYIKIFTVNILDFINNVLYVLSRKIIVYYMPGPLVTLIGYFILLIIKLPT